MTDRLNGALARDYIDGVYIDIDPTNLSAGTAWPIGTPGMPVNNLADAILINAARFNGHGIMYLEGEGVHVITLTTGFDYRIGHGRAYTITIAPGAVVGINSDLTCVELINTTGTPTIVGNLKCTFRLSTTTGTVTVSGDCEVQGAINITGAGALTVNKDLKTTGTITNSGGGAITVNGNAFVEGAFNNAGGGNIAIAGTVLIGGVLTLDGADTWASGDLHVSSITSASTGAFNVNGNLTLDGNLTINSALGAITVDGDVHIGGTLTTGTSATLTLYGNTYIYYLAHSSSGAIFIGGDLEMPTGIISNAAGNITVDGDVSIGTNWNNTGGGNCIVTGKIQISGTLTMDGADTWTSGNLHAGVVTNSSAGAFHVLGTLNVDENFVNGEGNSTIDGNTHIGMSISTTVGHILIRGNLHAGTSITVSGASGDLTVYGDVFCGDDFTTQNATSTITVTGDVRCGDGYIGTAGTLTIGGNCYLADDLANVAATVIIGGKLETGDDCTTTTGNIDVAGDAHIGGLLSATTGIIHVSGKLFVGETTTISGNLGVLHVIGDAILVGAVGATNAGATIMIDGIGRIYGVITNTGLILYKKPVVIQTPMPSFVESWQDAAYNPVFWTVTNPATGTAWLVRASGAYLEIYTIPALNETARLVSNQRWVFAPLVYGNNTVIRKANFEIECRFTFVANIDNAIAFFGLTTGLADTRATNNIIGWGLAADVLASVTDLAGVETTNTGFGETLTNWNKLRISVYANTVEFYVNEVLKATHITNRPDYPFYLNFYMDTEAGGTGTLELGMVRLWYEDL